MKTSKKMRAAIPVKTISGVRATWLLKTIDIVRVLSRLTLAAIGCIIWLQLHRGQ